MKLVIEINCDSPALAGVDCGEEIADMLRNVVNVCEHKHKKQVRSYFGGDGKILYDGFGRLSGTVKVIEEPTMTKGPHP